eukprot:5901647-Amphidinium_carterae.1
MQFAILPYRSLMANDVSAVCRVLSAHLNHSLSCNGNLTHRTGATDVHLRPSLEEEMGHHRLVHARTLLSNEIARLVAFTACVGACTTEHGGVYMNKCVSGYKDGLSWYIFKRKPLPAHQHQAQDAPSSSTSGSGSIQLINIQHKLVPGHQRQVQTISSSSTSGSSYFLLINIKLTLHP